MALSERGRSSSTRADRHRPALGDVARSFRPVAGRPGSRSRPTRRPTCRSSMSIGPHPGGHREPVANALRHTPRGRDRRAGDRDGGWVVLTWPTPGPGSIRPLLARLRPVRPRRDVCRVGLGWRSPAALSRPTAVGSRSHRPTRRGRRSRSSCGPAERTPDRRRVPTPRRVRGRYAPTHVTRAARSRSSPARCSRARPPS